MTGRYNFRNYEKFKYLNPNQRTFGHVAQSAGYTTAVAGKWQLDGSLEDDFSRKFGFDQYCVWYLNQKMFGSRYLHPRLAQNGKEVGGKGLYGPDIVNDFALQFISEHKDEKFFLYYPMILPHFPFEATPDSDDWDPAAAKPKKNAKYYVDMVEYADKLVGKVLAKVEELGLEDNTLILFTSDNGTMRGIHSQWNGQDYAGGKGRLDNTGTHVPLIVRWNKVVKGGQVSKALVDFSDFFATIQEVTGGVGPKDYTIDGKSFLPLLKGDVYYQERAYTYCYYDPKWGTPELGAWVRNQSYKVYGNEGPCYDVSADYFEKKPLVGDTAKAELAQLEKVMAEKEAEGGVLKLKFNRDGFPKEKKGSSKRGK
ncbi:sulfatase-like hydrolase/transferase [Rubritalea tangerina]|uniref:Sulfatase-like hydrolase/transferase n=2 Tax=Rubritalea tangerina TaxID=430798 RepID=A0ABW4Z8Q7_9BACT